MRSVRRSVLPVWAPLVAAAMWQCGARGGTEGRAVQDDVLAMTPVYQDQYGGPEAARRAVIRSPGDWAAFWSGAAAAPPPAAVDFSREMVIAAALGARPTGGYGVALDSARRVSGRLVVTVREVSPGPGCMVTQALTAPVVAVRVPRAEEPVDFVVVREQRSC